MATPEPVGARHPRLRKAADSGVHPALPRKQRAEQAAPPARKQPGARSTRSRG